VWRNADTVTDIGNRHQSTRCSVGLYRVSELYFQSHHWSPDHSTIWSQNFQADGFETTDRWSWEFRGPDSLCECRSIEVSFARRPARYTASWWSSAWGLRLRIFCRGRWAQLHRRMGPGGRNHCCRSQWSDDVWFESHTSAAARTLPQAKPVFCRRGALSRSALIINDFDAPPPEDSFCVHYPTRCVNSAKSASLIPRQNRRLTLGFERISRSAMNFHRNSSCRKQRELRRFGFTQDPMETIQNEETPIQNPGSALQMQTVWPSIRCEPIRRRARLQKARIAFLADDLNMLKHCDTVPGTWSRLQGPCIRLPTTQEQLRISDSGLETGDSKSDISVTILHINVAEFELFDSEGNAVTGRRCENDRSRWVRIPAPQVLRTIAPRLITLGLGRRIESVPLFRMACAGLRSGASPLYRAWQRGRAVQVITPLLRERRCRLNRISRLVRHRRCARRDWSAAVCPLQACASHWGGSVMTASSTL